MGRIFKRGKFFWIKYYRLGTPFRESTKSTKWSDAVSLLKKCEGDIASGKAPRVCFEKVMFKELVQAIKAIKEDYKPQRSKAAQGNTFGKVF